METKIGKNATTLTFQNDFPETINCTCGGEAKIALVMQEGPGDDPICELYENEGKGGFWPHDCIAVAIYFCKECCNCLTKWNQA